MGKTQPTGKKPTKNIESVHRFPGKVMCQSDIALLYYSSWSFILHYDLKHMNYGLSLNIKQKNFSFFISVGVSNL